MPFTWLWLGHQEVFESCLIALQSGSGCSIPSTLLRFRVKLDTLVPLAATARAPAHPVLFVCIVMWLWTSTPGSFRRTRRRRGAAQGSRGPEWRQVLPALGRGLVRIQLTERGRSGSVCHSCFLDRRRRIADRSPFQTI